MNRSMLLLLFAGVALVGCETLTEELPATTQSANPTAPGGASAVSPVTVPQPSSGGGGATTPTTSAPAATPTPTPAPVAARGCNLPRGTGDGSSGSCPRQSPSFLNEALRAVDIVIAEHPEYFDLNDTICSRCPKIRNYPAFERAIVEAFERQGLCAMYDGEEFAVKNTNAWNDQYDLSTGSFHVRAGGEGSYAATCYPAWF